MEVGRPVSTFQVDLYLTESLLVVGAMLRIHHMVMEDRPDEERVFSGHWAVCHCRGGWYV